jgi:hypothetical protein
MVLCALYLPITCYGQEALEVEFSPNIVNIDSERWGEIRILTDMRYSFYIANKAEEPLFIYFNDSLDSVQNIRATRDSLGNLILKFDLDNLLDVEVDLLLDELNVAEVVVVTENGVEYIGTGDILVIDKKGY